MSVPQFGLVRRNMVEKCFFPYLTPFSWSGYLFLFLSLFSVWCSYCCPVTDRGSGGSSLWTASTNPPGSCVWRMHEHFMQFVVAPSVLCIRMGILSSHLLFSLCRSCLMHEIVHGTVSMVNETLPLSGPA